MTDTAREPQERMPVITEKHVEAIAWLVQNRVSAMALNIDPATLREALALVRSISSGEAGIYDTRTEVKVSREDLWRCGVAFSHHRYDEPEFQLALQQIDRWHAALRRQLEASRAAR